MTSEVDDILGEHHWVAGSREDTTRLPAHVEILSRSPHERHTTLLVRSRERLLNPALINAVDLEALVLAYLERPDAALTTKSNKARHRLSRTGNRQLNAALHRIALTQAHWHEPAKVMMDRRKTGGDSGMEALRVLKRRLSDVIYAALRADLSTTIKTPAI